MKHNNENIWGYSPPDGLCGGWSAELILRKKQGISVDMDMECAKTDLRSLRSNKPDVARSDEIIIHGEPGQDVYREVTGLMFSGGVIMKNSRFIISLGCVMLDSSTGKTMVMLMRDGVMGKDNQPCHQQRIQDMGGLVHAAKIIFLAQNPCKFH